MLENYDVKSDDSVIVIEGGKAWSEGLEYVDPELPITQVSDLMAGEMEIAGAKYHDVTKPKHYNQGKYEVIDVIEDWKLNFNRGNVIKYTARAGKKDNEIKDLEKAKYYIEREIECVKELG